MKPTEFAIRKVYELVAQIALKSEYCGPISGCEFLVYVRYRFHNRAVQPVVGQSLADIFISYKSDDRWFAELLSSFLMSHGWSVWYDAALGADDNYYELIKTELENSEIVVALWSERSSDSRWVYAEADIADKEGKLINATIDGTIPPIPFNRKNCLDLIGWTGHSSDPQINLLVESIQILQRELHSLPKQKRTGPTNSRAALAWSLISDSLVLGPYEEFLRVHASSSQASLAENHLISLKRWNVVDKENPFEVYSFIQQGPFSKLGEEAKATVKTSKEQYLKKNIVRIRSRKNANAFGSAETTHPLLWFAFPLIYPAALLVFSALFWLALLPFMGFTAMIFEAIDYLPNIATEIDGLYLNIVQSELYLRTGFEEPSIQPKLIAAGICSLPFGALFWFIFLKVIFGLVLRETERIDEYEKRVVENYYSKKLEHL